MKVKPYVSTLLLLAGTQINLTMGQEVDQHYRIEFKTGTVTPIPLAQQRSEAGLVEVERTDEPIASSEPKRFIIQFKTLPNNNEIRRLDQSGVHLHEYLGSNSYYATTKADGRAAAAQNENVRSLQAITLEQKIHPKIRAATIATAAADSYQTVTIQLFDNTDFDRVSAQIEDLTGTVIKHSKVSLSATVSIPSNRIDALAELGDVKFVEPAPPPKQQFNDGVRANIGADTVEDEFGLTGKGVTVGIWDGGIVASTHSDFSGRLTLAQPNASVDDHATHVAGTLGGDGRSSNTVDAAADELLILSMQTSTEGISVASESPNIVVASLVQPSATVQRQWQGVAPEVGIVSYFWDTSTDDHEEAIGQFGIEISQNSWGYAVSEIRGNCDLYGEYITESAAYDRIVTGVFGQRIPVVFAAGNERNDQDCGMVGPPAFENYANIAPPQTAKNVITIGAINSDDNSVTEFSSYGPTQDGRIKPDVVTAGCESEGSQVVTSTLPPNRYGGMCGTSMAAPAASGGIAILMQQHKLQSESDQSLLPSSYKGLLLHAATDLETMGPDYKTGFGRINLKRSVQLLRENAVTESEIHETASRKIAGIQVPTEAKELKVSLVWDDAPASTNAIRALVNDLDLQVVSPSGESHLPWVLNPNQPTAAATIGVDRVNVMEQIRVAKPTEGIWRIAITGTAIPKPPQQFSLIVSVD